MLRLGVDVGGTNTDAVIVSGAKILGTAKVTTTPAVTDGVVAAARAALEASHVRADEVRAVMVGTTHFTNALVERQGLAPTAIVRLGLPATTSVPPFADWPVDLAAAVGAHAHLVGGGHEFDGREIAPLDEAALAETGRTLHQAGVRAVAVVGVFSAVVDAHERRAAAILARAMPGAAISLSHEIGRVGLLERENATALNACLAPLAARTIESIARAIASVAPTARLYLTQNDGTLMRADDAKRTPVLTVASGPTNSMRGAAFLSGMRDAIVVDVGGTTTDVGAVVRGFPREASVAVRVAGVRPNFRMPDLVSIGLGGGSLVADGGARVGPRSVGAALAREARVFGGSTLTATDIAVAGRRADIGDAARVRDLDDALVRRALGTIDAAIADAIDKAKTTARAVSLVLVGGGSVLVSDALTGVSRVTRPAHFAVANAVGAAIAEVSGEIDRVFSLEAIGREEALAEARAEALQRAVAAGASEAGLEIVELEEVPLAYLPSNAVRIRAKAVGALADG
jgi:N-methylhydantoinase A/oxoprolinase/acetone carboxylase beta subunit